MPSWILDLFKAMPVWLEGLLVGAVIVIAYEVLKLADSGQAVTFDLAVTAIVGALLSYLTSKIRELIPKVEK